jgi:transcriptional regulator with XRE-family HTH domain
MCCYSRTVQFDQARFYDAVEQNRRVAGLSWRQLALRLSLSPSTFTRLAQGRRPDVDTFVKLLAWMERPAADFVRGTEVDSASEHNKPMKDTVREIGNSLRQDPALTSDSAEALEDIVRVAYRRLRQA